MRATRFVMSAQAAYPFAITHRNGILKIWCLEPESNRHAPFLEAADFKSDVSTNFTIEAVLFTHCESKDAPPPS
jgi:hypothetical protein